MPEMTFEVRWPDGRTEECYSPSLVIHDHLRVGGVYSVADFTRLTTHALGVASERVRARYGFACSSAMATTQQVLGAAARYDDRDTVEVLRMEPPLPEDAP